MNTETLVTDLGVRGGNLPDVQGQRRRAACFWYGQVDVAAFDDATLED